MATSTTTTGSPTARHSKASARPSPLSAGSTTAAGWRSRFALRWVDRSMWLSEWRKRRQRKNVVRMLPRRAHVGYVLAQVRDDVLDDIPTHFRRAVTAAREVGGLAELAPPLLLVLFGL